MSYIDQSLGDNEEIHYRAHFPAVRTWLAAGIMLLGLVLAALAISREAWGSSIVLAGTAAVVAISIMYEVWTTEIAVTTQRLVYARGLFQRRTKELQIKAIEEIRLQQDFLGRVFNYGRLNFHGTGVDDLKLPALGDPVGFQKAIQEAIGAAATPVSVEVAPPSDPTAPPVAIVKHAS